MRILGVGPVFHGSAKLSEVQYRLNLDRPITGTLIPLEGQPSITVDLVQDVTNEKLTLRLECGCQLDLSVQKHSRHPLKGTNETTINGRGPLRLPSDIAPHEHY